MNPCPSARPGEGEQEENRQGGPPGLAGRVAPEDRGMPILFLLGVPGQSPRTPDQIENAAPATLSAAAIVTPMGRDRSTGSVERRRPRDRARPAVLAGRPQQVGLRRLRLEASPLPAPETAGPRNFCGWAGSSTDIAATAPHASAESEMSSDSGTVWHGRSCCNAHKSKAVPSHVLQAGFTRQPTQRQ